MARTGGSVVSTTDLSKRLHCREFESHEFFSKRLRRINPRVLNLSKVVVNLGPEAEKHEFSLPAVLLVNYSVKLKEIIDSTFPTEEDGEASLCSVTVLHLPDFRCDADTFSIIDDFLLQNGELDESAMCISNVVRVFNAAKFLQIESLLCATKDFFEKNVFDSWENCLAVLATFDCNDLSSSNADIDNRQFCLQAEIDWESTIFEVCEMAFLRTITDKGSERSIGHGFTLTDACNGDCFLQVGQKLQPSIANRIYRSSREARFGLHLSTGSCGSHPIRHMLKEDLYEVTPHWFVFNIARDMEALIWIESLPHLLPNLSRRSLLVWHLSKMLRLTNFAGSSHSNIEMSFICALLREATELNKAAKESAVAIDLGEEIMFLTKLVAEGLLDVCLSMELFAEDTGRRHVRDEVVKNQNLILMLVIKFDFRTFLSIVKHFRLYLAEGILSERGVDLVNTKCLRVANIVDSCIRKHMKARSLSTQQVLIIYKEFPNNVRPSHVDFYNLMRTATFTAEELLELTKILDYDKLPVEIVEKLFTELRLDSDPGIVIRFLEIQEMKLKDQLKRASDAQKKYNDELVHLRNELMRATDARVTDDEELVHLRCELERASDARVTDDESSCTCDVN